MRRLVMLLLVAAAACSVQDGPIGEASPTIVAASSPPSGEAPSTTEAMPESTAVILIGPARYDLTAICAAGGAGEVEVSVAGTDVNDVRVVGYIRAFLGEPYVSLQVGEGVDAVLFEPRLEGSLRFEFTDGRVHFPEVEFVTDLDLATGDFVPAGIGSVEVDCRSFVRELPPVPFG